MLDRWQEPPCSWAVHIHKADRSFEGNWLSGQLPSIIGAALEYTVLWFDRRNSKLSRLSRSVLREAASGRSSSGISDMSATSRQRHYQLRHKRSEEHTSELQSPCNLVCRLLLEKKKNTT